MLNSLLTPKEVANLLKVSPRTVYDRAVALGGFYPAGIRVLRFRPEVINGYMEGQTDEGMGLQIRVSEKSPRREGVQDQERGRGRPRKAPGGSKRAICGGDQNRHRI